MFYEKLAEAKEEKKRRLSGKQKLGLGLATTAGLGAGAGTALGGLGLAYNHLKPVSDFYDDDPRNYKAISTLGAGGLLGAGIAGYGAKKLYDQHNELKRLREERSRHVLREASRG